MSDEFGISWNAKVDRYITTLNYEGLKRITVLLLTDNNGKNERIIRRQIEENSKLL